MRIFLRIIAIFVGLAVFLTLLLVLRFELGGYIQPLVRSGFLGIATIAAWFIILIAGPIASINLWRLRRTGLYAAALLCALVLLYYIAGVFLFRAPGASLRPIIAALVVNGLILVILLSPAARRSCA
jgi:hypothetical protein